MNTDRQVRVFVGEDGLVGLLHGEPDDECDVAYFSHPDGGAFEKADGENKYDPEDVAHCFAAAYNATYAAGVNPDGINQAIEDLKAIYDMLDLDNPDSYASDDSIGAIDSAFARAQKTLANLSLEEPK